MSSPRPQQQRVINALVAEKRRSDPSGYAEAARSGRLYEYLETDLRAAGIDASSFLRNNSGSSSGSSSSSSGSSSSSSSSSSSGSSGAKEQADLLKQGDGLVRFVSMLIDESLCAPLFEKNTDSTSKQISAKIAEYGGYRRLEENLRYPKVALMTCAVLCFGFSLSNLLQGRLLHVVLYAVLAHDALVASINCYSKFYLFKAVNELTGSVSAISTTIFSGIKNALGLGGQRDKDPLVELQENVKWRFIFEDTMTAKLLAKLPINNNSKTKMQ